MRNGFQDLEPALGELGVQELRQTRAERRIFMNDHYGLRRLAGLIIEGYEILERCLGDDPEAGPEPERILQPAGDDAVDHSHVYDIGKVIARGGLPARQPRPPRI